MDVVSRVDDIALWITVVLAGLAAIGAATRWLVKVIRRIVVWAEEQGRRLERVDELAKELRPNGGRSIKDVTDETATAVADLQAAVADLKTGAGKLGDAFAIHLVQAAARDSRLSEIEAAVTYLAESGHATEDLAAAIGPAIRSTPHECDVHHEDGDETGP